jgi:hypothetical protein
MSKASDKNIQWMYENDDGTGYNPYNQDVSNILDYIYIQRNIFWSGLTWDKPNPLTSEFIIPSYLPSERFRFLFNFDTMEQTNLNSDNYKSLDPNTKRLATRGIIRLMNDRVWVQYLNDGRFDFKYVDDITTVRALNRLTTEETRGGGSTILPYTSKNLDRQISFDELINKGKYMYQCNGGTVIVQGCTVQELLQLKQQRFNGKSLPVAPPPPPQVQKAPFGDKFYLIPGTNFQTSIYQDGEGRDYFMYKGVTHYIDPGTREAYHYDTSSSKNVWSFRGGSSIRTGKKKKQFIKRNKTYKKKRNNKRKTIKK